MLIAEAVERYLTSRENRLWPEEKLAPNTVKADRSALRQFAEWAGEKDLSTFTAATIADYRLTKRKLSPASAAKTRYRIMGFWTWANRLDLGVRMDALDGWPLVTGASHVITVTSSPISAKRWPALINACPSQRNRAAMALHLHLGISYGALTRLRVGDYRDGILTVPDYGQTYRLKAERAELDAWLKAYGQDPGVDADTWTDAYLFPAAPRGGYRGRYIPDKHYEGLTKALRSAKRSVLGTPTA